MRFPAALTLVLVSAALACRRSEPASPPAAPAPASPASEPVASPAPSEPPAPVVGAPPAAPAASAARQEAIQAVLNGAFCLMKREDRTGLAQLHERHGFVDAADWAQAFAAARARDPAWATQVLADATKQTCGVPAAPATPALEPDAGAATP